MQLLNNWKLIVLGCLTLGLAPFSPEPHLWGKVKWIIGGSSGMQFADWFDTVLHSLPFLLLFRYLILKIIQRKTRTNQN